MFGAETINDFECTMNGHVFKVTWDRIVFDRDILGGPYQPLPQLTCTHCNHAKGTLEMWGKTSDKDKAIK